MLLVAVYFETRALLMGDPVYVYDSTSLKGILICAKMLICGHSVVSLVLKFCVECLPDAGQ